MKYALGAILWIAVLVYFVAGCYFGLLKHDYAQAAFDLALSISFEMSARSMKNRLENAL